MRRALVTMRQWFDSDYFPEGAQVVRERPDRFEWRRCLPFVFLYISCVGVVWVDWSWTAVAVAAALYWVRMFAITAPEWVSSPHPEGPQLQSSPCAHPFRDR